MDDTLEYVESDAQEPAEDELVAQEAARLMAKDPCVLEQPACDEQAEMTFEGRVAAIMKLMDNPNFREIYFAILDFCREQRGFGAVEDMVGMLPEFAYCAQNQYRLIVNLEDADALERLELDEYGAVVTGGMKEGLTEDEVDDLVADYAFVVTGAGRAACEKMRPSRRMEELMGMFPKRVKTYCQVLEFCKEPRAFREIDALLKGSGALKAGSVNTATGVPLQSSAFIDQLERSGALVWNGSWNVTEWGRRYLELTQKLAS